MGDDKPKYDLPDSVQENIQRREIVKKTIEHGREQVRELETYQEKLLHDYNTRLIPEERQKRAQENNG